MQSILTLARPRALVWPWGRTQALAIAVLGVGAAFAGQTLLPEHPPQAGLLFIAGAGGFTLGIWRLFPARDLAVASEARALPLRRLAPLAAPAALIAVALVLFARDIAPPAVIALWLAGLAGLAAIAWRLDHGSEAHEPLEWRWADWGLIAALIAIASFFRVWHLDYLPGVPGDESPHVEYAYLVLDGKIETPFEEGYWSNSALVHYMTAGLMLLGFSDIWALKLTGAIPGILVVPFLYLLLRELMNRPAAAFGAALLAVANWHVLNSRFGYAVAIDALTITASLYFFVLGLRTARHLDFAASALFLGFGMAMTRVAVMAPVLIAVLAAYLVLRLGWRRAWQFRTHALLLVVITCAFFSPRALYIFRAGPTNALDRHEEVFLFSKSEWADGKENPLRLSAENAADYYLMFTYRSGTHSQWNARPGEPALDVAASALLVIGVAFALARLRSWPSVFFLGATVVLLVPGIITLTIGDNFIMQHRAIGLAPVVFGLAALPLWLLWQALPHVRWHVALAVAALGVLAFSAYDNYQAYFGDYGNDLGAYYWTDRPEAWAARELLRLDDGHQLYVTASELHPDVINDLTRRHASYQLLASAADLPVPAAAEGKGLAFIVTTGRFRSDGELAPALFDAIAARYPEARIASEERDPDGELVGVSFVVDAEPPAAQAPPAD
jgi:hypothetical protein